jgi:hypothetical protein
MDCRIKSGNDASGSVLRLVPRAARPSRIGEGMTQLFKSIRRSRCDHRQVFAEFALTLMYLRAEQAVKKRRARLRVVG